jgi:L-seryl-tRNA(Ser) seleniumtransferase
MPSLRDLPSVDQVLRNLPPSELSREIVIAQVQSVIAARRKLLLDGNELPAESIEAEISSRLRSLAQPSLVSAINATGVILHTNLGRAPIPPFQLIDGYSNLEYNLATGKRGKRDAHTAHLLEALLHKPAIVVNNNAAAVYLVLKELAEGHEVLISRGELIEIGDGFRIPQIMESAGVILREVGTTNRTSLDDYRDAITPRTKLILRVHPSNFHISGFTAKPTLADLCGLGIPVYEDLGSGCLVDLSAHGINEPLVSQSLEAGVNVVSFSCDKLLGGPQSGIIAGDADLITRIRRNPMYRAFRADKLIVQSLQTSLLHLVKQEWQAIPALRMIMEPLSEVRKRAEQVLASIPNLPAHLKPSETAIGGGSTPDQSLPTWIIEIDAQSAQSLERKLRTGTPPVITRIQDDRVILDLRTVSSSEVDALVVRITECLPNSLPG